MNKITTIVIAAVGATVLFGVSFLGFAKLNGAPLHTLPVLGKLFPAPQEKDAPGEPDHAGTAPPATPTGEAPAPANTANPANPEHPADAAGGTHEAAATPPADPKPQPPREARAGVFSVLDGDALYSQDELRALADSLRTKNREADQRTAELQRREDLLADRLNALEERRHGLDEFAKQLDARQRELEAREAEAARDASAPGGKGLPPGELATFFADGETELVVQRLAGFTAAEVGQILSKLQPARARELLDALPNTRWRECAEAYARASQPPQK